jgi:hypothetical protein
MNKPKTIQIFLPDGSPRSIRIATITTSIGQASLIPRSKLKDASGRQEILLPGIYFLIGEQKENGKREVYIGEAEHCFKRITQHDTDEKEFWTTAIAFTSKTNNLNKAHVKYLEHYCCVRAKEINRCELVNSTSPTKSNVSEQDEADLMDFFDTLKILIGTLGYPIFEELRSGDSKTELVCKGKEALAKGEYTDEGLLVYKGSTLNLELTKTAGSWVKGMRENLLESKVIAPHNNVYIFLEDHLFNSPSAAAAAVLARRANGWIEWKNKDGKTLDELKRK